MKIGCLVIAIVVTALSGIGFVVCLLLPAMTSNRVSFDESVPGLIASGVIFFLSFVGTVIAAILVIKGRKKSV